ncbi:hypothetical protein [Streptomyces sp. NPDC001537]
MRGSRTRFVCPHGAGRGDPVVFRICSWGAAGWDAWDGALALQGADPHAWLLKRMLNAAEAAMDAAAQDESERARNRAELYASPKGVPAG